MQTKLTGLIAAPHTPFDNNHLLNLDLIPKQAEWLSRNDVAGAFVCGTTGEWSSLTVEERMKIAERWIASAPDNLKIIVHVGHNSLADARSLAAHAMQGGAFAIAAIAPDFFRPASVGDLVEYCAEIARAAPALPFYYYHMPAMNGVTFAVIDFLKAAHERIPNLAGVKYTFENLMDYRQCVAFEGGRYNVLFGRDEILLSALVMGADGFVGSTYNFAAPVYHKVIAAFRSGNLQSALQHQTEAIEMIASLSRHGGIAAGKAVMKMLGIDCGPVRAPLRNLSNEQYTRLHQELQNLGILANTQ